MSVEGNVRLLSRRLYRMSYIHFVHHFPAPSFKDALWLSVKLCPPVFLQSLFSYSSTKCAIGASLCIPIRTVSFPGKNKQTTPGIKCKVYYLEKKHHLHHPKWESRESRKIKRMSEERAERYVPLSAQNFFCILLRCRQKPVSHGASVLAGFCM